MVMLAVPTIAAAMGSGGMIYWASTNVYQTRMIDRQKREQMKLDRDELEFDQQKFHRQAIWREQDYARQLDINQSQFEQSLAQTLLIQEFDEQAQQFQSNMQSQRLGTQVELYNAQQRQMLSDREMYLMNAAMDDVANILDPYTIAFQLTELIKIKHSTSKNLIPFTLMKGEELDETETDYDDPNNIYYSTME